MASIPLQRETGDGWSLRGASWRAQVRDLWSAVSVLRPARATEPNREGRVDEGVRIGIDVDAGRAPTTEALRGLAFVLVMRGWSGMVVTPERKENPRAWGDRPGPHATG